MPTYKAPVEDVQFLLNDVFHMERYGNMPGFSDASPDVVAAILEDAAKFTEEVLTPLNRSGDQEGCKRSADGSVATPKGFREAYRQLVEGGWVGISIPSEYGGQGLPATMTMVVNEMLASSNMAFAMYPGLTQGAIAALLHHGTPEQRKTYLPKMVAGEWTGTMNLTEPHCGTDLGMLRSKAVPQPDGSYKITGTKIFIRPASTILRRTSSIRARAHEAPGREGPAVHRAEAVKATVSRRNGVLCGRSSTRWAFTAIRPACSIMTARPALSSAKPIKACGRCSR